MQLKQISTPVLKVFGAGFFIQGICSPGPCGSTGVAFGTLHSA